MKRMVVGLSMKRMVVAFAATACAALATTTGPAAAESAHDFLHVDWMPSYAAPGTPAKYNKVGVIKIGPSDAKNVLVLEPGTQAAGGYFIPFAEWLVSKVKGWQVWSVERRESLLEDQSVLNLAKEGKASEQQVFNYYLGYLANPSIKDHIQSIPDSSLEFGKNWGANVAVQDMHTVIDAAHRLGGKVVLGGHSLGGALVTAYATWDFNGKPGADGLSGLVFDDGGGFGAPETAQAATQALQALNSPSTSPWLAEGVPAPLFGLFGATGALAAIQDPNQPAIGETFPLLPSNLNPGVPVTNLALFAWNTDVPTSKLGIFAFLAHLGPGLDATPVDGVYGWNSTGALTPPERWAAMLAGPNLYNGDGVEWYFPERLFTDTMEAIDQGNANPAQQVLGMKATMGHGLPKSLKMYAFGAYGGAAITDAATQLADQSGIPSRNLTLINEQGVYAHNDPAGAYPNNIFFDHLVPFLEGIGRHR